MMHGRGKSDSPIVPGKPPTKAALVAAEAVEGRGGAKGNAIQSSTHQTQSWASVSQAMDRIRCAARRDKRVRLTALLHHVNVDLLRFAFHQLKRRAAPGVDGITWHEYEADLEANLVDCMDAYSGAPTGRSRPGGSTSPNPTAGNDRSASPRWRTKSFSAQWWRC
jgi:RNA-directed DNA polymerase